MEIKREELEELGDKLIKKGVAANGLASQPEKFRTYTDALPNDGSIDLESIDSVLGWIADNMVGLQMNIVKGKVVTKSLIPYGGTEEDLADDGIVRI
ncbi:MAG: hypothetical protein PF517_04680 [Salinivirgaceae bacterium]|jgi:hypothetical protein|nr:hypothetical protein [Salinivirgaceae bacterium]